MRAAPHEPQAQSASPSTSAPAASTTGAPVQRRELRGLGYDQAVQRLSPVQRAEAPGAAHVPAASGTSGGPVRSVQRVVQRESRHTLSQVKQQQQQHLVILGQIDSALAAFGKTHKVPHLVPGAQKEASKLVRAHPDSADQVLGLINDFLTDDQVAAMSPGSKGVILNHLKSVLADLNVEFGGQRTLTCAAQLAKAIMKKKDMRGMLVRMRGVLHGNKMAKTFDPKNLDDMAVAEAGDTNLDRINHGFGGGMGGMHHQYGAGMSDDQLGKAVFRGGKGMSPCASGSFKGGEIDAAVFSALLARAKAGELAMVTLEKKGGAMHKMMVLGTAAGPRLWDPNESSPTTYNLQNLRNNLGEHYTKAHGWTSYAKKDNPWAGRRDL